MKKRAHPILSVPPTPLETLLGVLIVLGSITVVAITIWGWLTLPAIIPVHYNLAGEVNAYGGKERLLLLPIITVCLAAFMTILSRFPHLYNYPWPITMENAPRQYALARLMMRWIALEVVWMMCGLQWILIQAAQGDPGNGILIYVLVMVLTLVATIIWYILAASRAR